MSLAAVLRRKFPDATVSWNGDIVLQDDGRGQYISSWNTEKLGPKPTEQQIADAIAAYVPPVPPTKAQKIAAMLAREGLTLVDLKAELAR